MGLFGNKEETKNKLVEAHKYVKTIHVNSNDELDMAIANEMKTRIIKDIKFHPTGTAITIIYDVWAEKTRNEKENNREL